MRILYILTSLGVGGAEKLVIALADRMAARGHAVAFLVLRPPLVQQLATAHTVVHLDMRRNPLSVLRAMLRGRRFLGEFKPDIIHSHGFHGNIVARIFHLLGTDPPSVSTIHNVYEGGWRRMLVYRLTDPLARLTAAVSAAARDRFVRLHAVPAHKCIVLTNGINIAEFKPDPARRIRTRATLGLGDEFVWLAAGRIAAAKDYPNLLRAFALVCLKQEPGCPTSVCSDVGRLRLWIAGEPADPAESSRLRSLTEELRIEGSTKFLGLRRDLPALLDAADAFVLSSAWEGMPLVVAEAMAMEKPVVATDAGGTRELLGDCGMLVSAHDPAALARAMLAVMRADSAARKLFGLAARARIVQNFSIDARADAWETLYIGIIRKPV